MKTVIYYLDTSAFLEWLFKDNADFKRPQGEDIITSDLLRIETHRTFHRLRLENKINDNEFVRLEKIFINFWESIHVIFPDEEILNIATKAFPTLIGTLDAIHLATAILFQEKKKVKLTIITNDKQLATTGEACGFTVVDHKLQ